MRDKLLKTLAVAAFGMITFPFVLTNDALSFENIDVLRLLAYYAGFTAVFGFGYVLGLVTKAHKKLLLPCRFLGAGTFCLSLILLLFTDEPSVIFAVGASAVFWWFLGERASRKHYSDFFPMFMFGVYIALTLLCYFFYGAMANDDMIKPVQNAVIAAFMAELCLAALLVNQCGIFDKANRRRETKTTLPKGLSGYNARLVLIVTLTGMLLFLLSDKIVRLLQAIIRLIAELFFRLLSFKVDPLEIQESEQQTPELPIKNDPSVNEPLLYLAAIVLIIMFRKQIWNVIKSAAKNIYSFFVRDTGESEGDMGFVDYTEQAPRRKTRSERIGDQALLRKYRAESVPETKFRIGYRLLLRKLDKAQAGIVPSDTTAEHFAKGSRVFGEGLLETTECYNAVRYNGEKPSDESFKRLEGLIDRTV